MDTKIPLGSATNLNKEQRKLIDSILVLLVGQNAYDSKLIIQSVQERIDYHSLVVIK